MHENNEMTRQTVRVYGQADQQAYERTVEKRAVTFTCKVCHRVSTQWRYPGPLPQFCSPTCQELNAQHLNEQRVKRQREKRRALSESRRQMATPTSTEDREPPVATAVPPLLTSKLAPPRLSTLLVERRALQQQLDSVLEHRLTLIQAPAGSGKTTAVNQWLASHSGHDSMPAVAWVSLDEGENDLLCFWRYVLSSCLTLFAPADATGLDRIVEQPVARYALNDVLTHFLNSLARQTDRGLLIIDDYHVVTEPGIHESLAFFIQYAPATLSLVLISRSEPTLPLARWRARGELYELYASDLRFSTDDAQALLAQVLPVTVSSQTITRLDHVLEGWATGWRLFSLALQRQTGIEAIERVLHGLVERGDTLQKRFFLNYFVSEVLNTQSEESQLFLLQTSILRVVSAPLCAALTGQEGSGTQLATLERNGLFVEALENGWYRYHALFAEAMRLEAASRLGTAALATLFLRASLWYEQQGMLSEAVEAALLSSDHERTANLIERLAMQEAFHEPATFLRWLAPLPEMIWRHRPMLCFIGALGEQAALSLLAAEERHTDPRNERVEELLQIAEQGWHVQGNTVWVGAIYAFRAINVLEMGAFSEAIDYAHKALTLLPEQDPDRRVQLWHCSCLLLVGMEQLLLGHLDQAHRLILDALARSNPLRYGYLTLQIRQTLARSYLLRGELRQARDTYQQVLAEARAQEDHELGAEALLALASLAFERNELTTVDEMVQEAFELSGQASHQQQELRERARFQQAQLVSARGEQSEALQQLQGLAERLGQHVTGGVQEFLPFVLSWRGRLLLVSGAFQQVEHELLQPELHEGEPAFLQTLLLELLKGRLLLNQGRLIEAEQQLQTLLESERVRLYRYYVWQIKLQLALVYHARQLPKEALQHMQEVLHAARTEGCIRLFLDEGEPVIHLLRTLFSGITQSALRTYIQSILRASSKDSAQSTMHTDGVLLEPLSRQEQRVLKLLIAGKSNQDIAQELIVSVNTVKDHIRHLYRKLNVHNRLQASVVAQHLDLD